MATQLWKTLRSCRVHQRGAPRSAAAPPHIYTPLSSLLAHGIGDPRRAWIRRASGIRAVRRPRERATVRAGGPVRSRQRRRARGRGPSQATRRQRSAGPGCGSSSGSGSGPPWVRRTWNRRPTGAVQPHTDTYNIFLICIAAMNLCCSIDTCPYSCVTFPAPTSGASASADRVAALSRALETR